jgi:hypothetical protein
MKSLLALLLSATLVALAADVIAGEFRYFAGEDEELYGEWVNMNYGARPLQKWVFNPDGTAWACSRADLDAPEHRMRYLITGKWEDPNGNIMYKSHWIGSWGAEAFQLSRISDSGNKLEYVFHHKDYPKEIDPKNVYYRVYTRK